MTTRVHVLHPNLKTRGRVDDDRPRRTPERALEEAMGLVDALPDMEIVGAEIVNLPTPHPGMLFGSGKVTELHGRLSGNDADLVIIDGHLSPVQQRNLERAWKVKILDRTGLILEIFGERAQTREGVLQVELAHLTYAKTRLVRSWTHLERQRGGLGFVGGPGETQIEADRRAIDEKISKIHRKLEGVVRMRALHRAKRKKAPYPVVALVGYTNAGKSTLFNAITTGGVLAQDMLFATLDPTMRALDLPSGRRVIFSDTVGFISDLPTQLVAAFRATLEEVLEADLILHVRDISHPEGEAQRADVLEVLGALGVDETAQAAMLEVFNKIDLMAGADRRAAENEAARRADAVAVSSVTGEGLDALIEAIDARLGEGERTVHLSLPPSAGEALAWLHANLTVLETRQTDAATLLTLRGFDADFGRFEKRFSGVAQLVSEAEMDRLAAE